MVDFETKAHQNLTKSKVNGQLNGTNPIQRHIVTQIDVKWKRKITIKLIWSGAHLLWNPNIYSKPKIFQIQYRSQIVLCAPIQGNILYYFKWLNDNAINCDSLDSMSRLRCIKSCFHSNSFHLNASFHRDCSPGLSFNVCGNLDRLT